MDNYLGLVHLLSFKVEVQNQMEVEERFYHPNNVVSIGNQDLGLLDPWVSSHGSLRRYLIEQGNKFTCNDEESKACDQVYFSLRAILQWH